MPVMVGARQRRLRVRLGGASPVLPSRNPFEPGALVLPATANGAMC